MAKVKLTAANVPALGPGEYFDTLSPAIYRVRGKRRVWSVRTRMGEKNKRVVLGYFPAMGLAEAREAARMAASQMMMGTVPPSRGRRTEPAVKRKPAAVTEPPGTPGPALTLGDLIDRYEAMRTEEGGRIKSLDAAVRTVRRELADWLDTPAGEFSKNDLRAARDRVRERGTVIASNRLLGYFGPIIRWACEEDLLPYNFVRDIRRAPERKRTRKLAEREIKAVWNATFQLAGPSAGAYGRLVRFLLLSGQRRDEAASMRHGDVLGGFWRWAKNKSDREHRLKLPPLALEQLGQGEAHKLCFAGVSGKISGWSKLKAELDELSGVGGERGAPEHWQLHDLRRTASSMMEELGVPRFICHRVLNHAEQGLDAVYQQSDLNKQTTAALETWAAEVERIVGARRAA